MMEHARHDYTYTLLLATSFDKEKKRKSVHHYYTQGNYLKVKTLPLPMQNFQHFLASLWVNYKLIGSISI